MNPHTHLDLFSGIGGFSLAAEAAGFRTVAFCEIDRDASLVLKHHWPNTPNLGDIKHLKREHYEHELPTLVTGGVPCQPASSLGQMRGTADERWLWPEAIRIMREFRPRFGVFENPPSLLVLERGRAWNGIVSGLVALGYDLWWDQLAGVDKEHHGMNAHIIEELVKARDSAEFATKELRFAHKLVCRAMEKPRTKVAAQLSSSRVLDLIGRAAQLEKDISFLLVDLQ